MRAVFGRELVDDSKDQALAAYAQTDAVIIDLVSSWDQATAYQRQLRLIRDFKGTFGVWWALVSTTLEGHPRPSMDSSYTFDVDPTTLCPASRCQKPPSMHVLARERINRGQGGMDHRPFSQPFILPKGQAPAMPIMGVAPNVTVIGIVEALGLFWNWPARRENNACVCRSTPLLTVLLASPSSFLQPHQELTGAGGWGCGTYQGLGAGGSSGCPFSVTGRRHRSLGMPKVSELGARRHCHVGASYLRLLPAQWSFCQLIGRYNNTNT